MSNKSNKSKRYNRKRGLAERYSVNVRTIDRMWRDGRLPPPDLYMGLLPLWSDETLDANDREAAKRPRSA